jgi:hypothetical protein
MLFDALDMYATYPEAQAPNGESPGRNPLVDQLAREFAARWMAYEPEALRTRFERDLAGVIARAVENGQRAA